MTRCRRPRNQATFIQGLNKSSSSISGLRSVMMAPLLNMFRSGLFGSRLGTDESSGKEKILTVPSSHPAARIPSLGSLPSASAWPPEGHHWRLWTRPKSCAMAIENLADSIPVWVFPTVQNWINDLRFCERDSFIGRINDSESKVCSANNAITFNPLSPRTSEIKLLSP